MDATKRRLEAPELPRWAYTLIWLAVIVVVWEMGATVVAMTSRTPANIMPHLYQIVASVFDPKQVSGGMTVSQIVLVNAAQTLSRAGMGFVLGAVAGFVLALLMKLSTLVERALFPYLMLIQMIPILGMAPIVLAITHDIGVSRVIIAAILTFYPVATNTLSGFNAVPPERLDLMQSYAASAPQVYLKVLVPSALPHLFNGLKIAAPMAITASILVDTLQGDGGLGSVMSQSLKHAMSVYVFWDIVFFSAFVGIGSTWLMGVIERAVMPWRRKGGSARRKRTRGTDATAQAGASTDGSASPLFAAAKTTDTAEARTTVLAGSVYARGGE